MQLIQRAAVSEFRERIRLAGTLISEAELAATLEECERVNAGEPITFFEITTAAAFLAFSRHKADAQPLDVTCTCYACAGTAGVQP